MAQKPAQPPEYAGAGRAMAGEEKAITVPGEMPLSKVLWQLIPLRLPKRGGEGQLPACTNGLGVETY